MQRKIIVGLVVMAVFVTAVLFSRTSRAQDAPKKGEPESKKPADLIGLLKKDADVPPPPLPVPSPAPVVDAPKPNPPKTVDADIPLLPTPAVGTPIPAPTPTPAAQTAPPPGPAVPQVSQPSFPLGSTSTPPIPPTVPPPSPRPANDPVDSVQVPQVKKDATGPRVDNPRFPPPGVPLPPVVQQPEAAPSEPRSKSSPWSLHVDLVNGQTIVTATVNKKHEFKIVCQHVDIQTAQCVLKATGKVRITGDALQGTCEHLAISLVDDRLVLEGGAEVRIQKTARSADTGDAKSAAFELKGQTLNLRVSDLQSASLVQSNWTVTEGTTENPRTILTSATSDGKQTWSQFGTLVRTTLNHDGRPVWRLEKAGETVLHFVTREGGYLTQYEGRNISVLGSSLTPSHSSMRTLLHVTHIALP